VNILQANNSSTLLSLSIQLIKLDPFFHSARAVRTSCLSIIINLLQV